MLEPAGFAEKQVLHPAHELDIFGSLEPHQLALVRAVEEGGGEPLRLADADGVPLGDLPDNLYVGVLVVQLRDAVESAPVDVLVRITAQQVHRCAYAQLTTKNVGTLGTDILTIGYISLG